MFGLPGLVEKLIFVDSPGCPLDWPAKHIKRGLLIPMKQKAMNDYAPDASGEQLVILLAHKAEDVLRLVGIKATILFFPCFPRNFKQSCDRFHPSTACEGSD